MRKRLRWEGTFARTGGDPRTLKRAVTVFPSKGSPSLRAGTDKDFGRVPGDGDCRLRTAISGAEIGELAPFCLAPQPETKTTKNTQNLCSCGFEVVQLEEFESPTF